MLLEKRSQVHITATGQFDVVLLLNGSDMGVIALVAQLSILVPRAVPAHTRRIIVVGHNTSLAYLGMMLSREGSTTSSPPRFRGEWSTVTWAGAIEITASVSGETTPRLRWIFLH